MRSMTVAAFAAASLLLCAAPSEAAPDHPTLEQTKGGGPVGAGVSAGTLNGATLKVWPVRTHGIVLHFGAPPVLNSLGIHLSYRLHLPPIVAPNGGPALHLQIGPAFRTRMVFQANSFVELGGGLVIGASVTVPSWPVELFAEVQPTFAGSVSAPGTGLGLGVEGVGGVRWFFGKSAQAEPVWEPEPVQPAPEPEPEPTPEEGTEPTEGDDAAEDAAPG